MPAVMPGNITKGKLLGALDNYLNDLVTTAKVGEMDALTTDLADGTQNLRDILNNRLRPAGPPPYAGYNADLNHFARDWCPRPRTAKKLRETWWPEEQPIDRIIRVAYRKLLDLFRADQLAGHLRRVDTYWACASSHFEIAVLEGPDQITLLFLTPPPGLPRHLPPNANHQPENIHVVGHPRPTPSQETSEDPAFLGVVLISRPRVGDSTADDA